jgi:hypothetical protein
MVMLWPPRRRGANLRPALQPVDRKDDQERGDQHHHRNGGRVGVAEFGQPDHDQKRRDLGDVRQVAGNEDHRTVFADGARKRQRETGQHGRHQARQDDLRDDMPAIGAEACRRLLDFAVEIEQHRLHRAHHEWNSDEHHRDENADRRECDLDAEFGERRAEPSFLREQRR